VLQHAYDAHPLGEPFSREFSSLEPIAAPKPTLSQVATDFSRLNILQELISNSPQKDSLVTQQGNFPADFNFDANSIGSILASHLLPYLCPEEIDVGLQKFYTWLKPGGKLFILSYTVFMKELVNEKFEREYKRRLENKIKWPGYLENFNEFSYPFEPLIEAESAFPVAL